QYAHRDHLCIPCSKIEQGIQSRGSKFDENYSLRWVSSAWTSTVKRNEPECGAREVKEMLRTNEILKLAKLGSMSRCNSQAHDPMSSL
ncbi:hypothetical protein, partial [Burkholderia vietnamiensis]